MKTRTLFTVFMATVCISLSAQTKENLKEFDVKIREMEEIQMIYYSFIGPYMQSYDDFPKLMAHIQQNGISMGPYSLGVYYDDPEKVPENELRSEIGFMVSEKATETKNYKYKKIPAGTAVSVKYKSMEEIYPAYKAIAAYIEKEGLKTEGFSVEIYYSMDPHIVDTEILMLLKE